MHNLHIMNTRSTLLALGIGAIALLGANVAQAWHVSGRVLCDENANAAIDPADTPLPGVMVVVENSTGSFTAVTSTTAQGTFHVEVPHTPDTYLAYLHPPTVPPGATVLLPAGGVHAFALTHAQPERENLDFLIDCVPDPTPSPPDDEVECGKVTGGGWITGTPTGQRGSFGVSGGIRRGEFWGHLNYIDHATGMHVRSTAVTAYAADETNSELRHIHYDVLIGTETGTAVVQVVDMGEPGRNDHFTLTLSNGYTASGHLTGGNLQLHKCPPGWASQPAAAGEDRGGRKDGDDKANGKGKGKGNG